MTERALLLAALLFLWQKFRPPGPDVLATDAWPPVAPRPVRETSEGPPSR